MDLSVRFGSEHDRDATFEVDKITWSPLTSPATPATGPASLPEDHHLLVAELDGEVVGYLEMAPATPLASNAHVRHIVGLAVLPSHRRRGIARALLSAAVEQAQSAGSMKLFLRVLEPNVEAQRCGFEVESGAELSSCHTARYVEQRGRVPGLNPKMPWRIKEDHKT